MRQRVTIEVLTAVAFMAILLFPGVVPAGTHDKMCRANERGNKYSLCHTYLTPGIRVACEQYAPKDAPPTAGIPVKSYECAYEGEGSNRALVCKGGYSLPHALTKTLTQVEFSDSHTRCSKLCDECTSGWEPWE
jgi:hypothetical protein